MLTRFGDINAGEKSLMEMLESSCKDATALCASLNDSIENRREQRHCFTVAVKA
jgi:hypothetical protein